MNISRRSFIGGAVSVGAAATLAGCKAIPSEDAINKIGLAFGATTGLVMDQCDIDDESRNVIIDIVNRGYTVVPAEGETVYQAWKRVAAQHVAKLVADGKVTEIQADLILTGFDLVLKGLTLLIARHPEIGVYGAITIAALKGFCDGFLYVYKPVNANQDLAEVTIDAKALKELTGSRERSAVGVKALRIRNQAK